MNSALTEIMHQMERMSLTHGTASAGDNPQPPRRTLSALTFPPVTPDDVAELCAMQNEILRRQK